MKIDPPLSKLSHQSWPGTFDTPCIALLCIHMWNNRIILYHILSIYHEKPCDKFSEKNLLTSFEVIVKKQLAYFSPGRRYVTYWCATDTSLSPNYATWYPWLPQLLLTRTRLLYMKSLRMLIITSSIVCCAVTGTATPRHK